MGHYKDKLGENNVFNSSLFGECMVKSVGNFPEFTCTIFYCVNVYLKIIMKNKEF